MLAAFEPKDVVGDYGAAYRLLEATLFVAWSVGAAVYPVFSRLTTTSVPPVGLVFERGVKLSIALTLPLAAGALVLAGPLVEVLYGSSYENAETALRLLAPAIALYPVCYLTGYLLVSQDRQRVMTWVYGLVALENVLANLVLIPWLSLDGAALGTSISQLLVAVALVAFARRTIGRIRWGRIAGGPGAGDAPCRRDDGGTAGRARCRGLGRNSRLPRCARALRKAPVPRGCGRRARDAPAEGLAAAESVERASVAGERRLANPALDLAREKPQRRQRLPARNEEKPVEPILVLGEARLQELRRLRRSRRAGRRTPTRARLQRPTIGASASPHARRHRTPSATTRPRRRPRAKHPRRSPFRRSRSSRGGACRRPPSSRATSGSIRSTPSVSTSDPPRSAQRARCSAANASRPPRQLLLVCASRNWHRPRRRAPAIAPDL